MNSNLIDQHLIDLLRIPAEQRTPEDIVDAISSIGIAAQIDLVPAGPLQQEQMKLAAIVDFLATELDIETYDISLSLRERQFPSISPLCAFMKDSTDGVRLIGFGRTAEEVLKDLHAVEPDKDAA